MVIVNKPLLAAALAALVFLVLHLWLGEIRYHQPALASNMTAEQKGLYTVLWHAISIIIALSAGAFFAAARRPAIRPAAWLALIQFCLFMVLDLAVGLFRLGAPWPLIQWLIILPIVLLAGWGLLGPGRRAEIQPIASDMGWRVVPPVHLNDHAEKE